MKHFLRLSVSSVAWSSTLHHCQHQPHNSFPNDEGQSDVFSEANNVFSLQQPVKITFLEHLQVSDTEDERWKEKVVKKRGKETKKPSAAKNGCRNEREHTQRCFLRPQCSLSKHRTSQKPHCSGAKMRLLPYYHGQDDNKMKMHQNKTWRHRNGKETRMKEKKEYGCKWLPI